MVAETQRLPLVVGERINIATATAVIRKHLRDRRRAAHRAAMARIIRAIEPWYDTGTILVERLQEIRGADGDRIEAGGEGPVRYFELQWFGLHVALQFGRTPKAVRS